MISSVMRLFVGGVVLFLTAVTQAGIPVWTFERLTPTTLSIAPGDTAFILYTVTNQSKRNHTLAMKPIPGISQVTGGGNCGNPFSLGYQKSCTLFLQVSGSDLRGNVVGGPNVCEQANGLECYQPNSKQILNITKLSLPPGPGQTTLSVSVLSLALSVNDPGLNTALTGTPRILTITNTGANTATNVTYSPSPALPAGTTITPANCGTIAPGGTCVLTIIPGATPSAAPGDTNPTPITLTIAGDNTNSLTPAISILTYGSVYQSGFLFSMDDTTPNTGNIGGKVAALVDQALPMTGIIWSSNGVSGGSADVDNFNIPGIYETSTNPPDACDGNTDGSCNTGVIVAHYSPPTTNPAVNFSFYASGLCSLVIDGRNDWYLPAICEMGYDINANGSGCGTQVAPTLQNMQSNLVDNGDIGDLFGIYWSSTEDSANPTDSAWAQVLATGGITNQADDDKFEVRGVRCVRIITP